MNQATPVLTWAAPAAITVGTALSSTQLNATASVPGTFIYNSAAGTTPALGPNTLSVTFTPTDTTDYTTATATVTLTVNNKATPAITWATPAPITYGTALGSAQLNASSGSVTGTFVYTPAAGTVLTVGSQVLSVTFTPTDTTDDTTATTTVTLTVNKATPLITWPTPAPITFGTTLSTAQLNATASVAGTFVYNPAAGTAPAAGTIPLSVTFTPTDTTDYTTATATVTLTVTNAKTTPIITWPTPADITLGTALSGTQLDATAAVPGTFVYSPAAGTIPVAGMDTLSVTFTPGDTTDYNPAAATVTLGVLDFIPNDPSGASSTQTVVAGAAATFSFSVAPAGSPTLLNDVTLSISGLPPGATATFTPTVIPAGSPTTGVNLVIQTSSSSAARNIERSPNTPFKGAPFAFALLLLPLLGMQSLRKRMQLVPRFAAVLLLAALCLGVAAGLTGCASRNAVSSTTYTVVVTETSASVHHSFNLTLVVRK